MSDKKIQKNSDNAVTIPNAPVIRFGGQRVNTKQKPTEADLMIVFDTTGSMDDKIEAIKRTCEKFLRDSQSLGIDLNFSLVAFGDIRPRDSMDTIKLVVSSTHSVQEMIDGLRTMPRNSGYGNGGESSFEAIAFALEQYFRPEAVRVMLLLTDEAAHVHQYSPEKVHTMLVQKKCMFFAATPNHEYFINLTKENAGEWELIGTQTSLEKLERLFARLSEKLANVIKEFAQLPSGDINEFKQLRARNK